MKRKDDDIVIVMGVLRVRVDEDGVVEEVRLVYGGMVFMMVVVKRVGEFLKGKKFVELEMLEGMMIVLS